MGDGGLISIVGGIGLWYERGGDVGVFGCV